MTYSTAISYLVDAGVFDALGIPPREVDVALLKDADRRNVTRSAARYLFDLFINLAAAGTTGDEAPRVRIKHPVRR